MYKVNQILYMDFAISGHRLSIKKIPICLRNLPLWNDYVTLYHSITSAFLEDHLPIQTCYQYHRILIPYDSPISARASIQQNDRFEAFSNTSILFFQLSYSMIHLVRLADGC